MSDLRSDAIMTAISAPLRLAVWSGPRNVSTALLRSWENRGDTAVCDEPLYAYYLQATGAEHPGRDEVIARHDPDWRSVARFLTGPVPGGMPVFYQKHMAHHLLPEVERQWLDGLEHAFLIRDPSEMLPSLEEILPDPGLDDTGLPQQVEIFESMRERRGRTPPVVDARDLLERPRAMLEALCEALGVEFTERMLSWPPGPRPTDGVWARHWYANVIRSMGFRPWRPRPGGLPDRLKPLYDRCRGLYDLLYRHRLQV